MGILNPVDWVNVIFFIQMKQFLNLNWNHCQHFFVIAKIKHIKQRKYFQLPLNKVKSGFLRENIFLR